MCFCAAHVAFMQNFACTIIQYFLQPFTSGVIESKLQKGELGYLVRLNLWLPSFNVPECCSLQAYVYIKMPPSLIFTLFTPIYFSVAYRTANTLCTTVISTKALCQHACAVLSTWDAIFSTTSAVCTSMHSLVSTGCLENGLAQIRVSKSSPNSLLCYCQQIISQQKHIFSVHIHVYDIVQIKFYLHSPLSVVMEQEWAI